MFPALDPTVPLLRRGPDEVQLGVDPDDAVVLSGLSDVEIRALERLDGTRPLGMVEGTDRFEALLNDLVAHGLVVDALSSPPRVSTVAVEGDGATGHALVGLLRDEGVHVLHGRVAVDEADLARRSGRPPLTGDPVDLVVEVAAGALSPLDSWWTGEVPFLPVVIRPHSTVVGPVVDGSGPCPRCLDLTRADHDPAWATVLAQMTRLREPTSPSPLTAMAAALAAARILDHLATSTAGTRRPPTTPADVSVEMTLAPPRLTRRSWSRHPRCGRHPARRPD